MTTVDPAELVTDGDLASVQEMVDQGAGLDIALYEHAPQWRARWVAEALEEAAQHATATLWDDLIKRGVPAVSVIDLRTLAAEYRDGRR